MIHILEEQRGRWRRVLRTHTVWLTQVGQILGDIRSAVTLPEDDSLLIIGMEGCLFAGKASTNQHNVEMLCCYLSLLSRENFLRNTFIHLAVINDMWAARVRVRVRASNDAASAG